MFKPIGSFERRNKMNNYNNKLNETVLKSNIALIRRLISAGKTDEAKLVLEYVKTWSEIAYFAKAIK
jgi:hypothetical protein